MNCGFVLFFGWIWGLEEEDGQLATNGDSSSLFSMQLGSSEHQPENDLMELRKASVRNPSSTVYVHCLQHAADVLIFFVTCKILFFSQTIIYIYRQIVYRGNHEDFTTDNQRGYITFAENMPQ